MTYTPAAGTTLFVLSASDTLILSADTERSKANAGYTKVKEFLITYPGTVRVTFDIKQSGGDLVYGQIRLTGNSTAITEDTTLSTSYVTKTQDVQVAAGDSLEIWIQGGASTTCLIQNARVKYTAGAFTTPSVVTN